MGFSSDILCSWLGWKKKSQITYGHPVIAADYQVFPLALEGVFGQQIVEEQDLHQGHPGLQDGVAELVGDDAVGCEGHQVVLADDGGALVNALDDPVLVEAVDAAVQG